MAEVVERESVLKEGVRRRAVIFAVMWMLWDACCKGLQVHKSRVSILLAADVCE